jgi:hypothetical protein
MPVLPVSSISFILGNYLAWGKVNNNPIVVKQPELTETDGDS